ncbi:MAG: SDR family NAD(P)-dependent oxidoreductase [Pyrinomonadaceae bacterium]
MRLLRFTKRRTLGIAADVVSAADVERLVTEVERGLGPIDILVNNAGINIRGAVEELSEADWDAVITTNLKGPVLMRQGVRPRHVPKGMGTRDQSGLYLVSDRYSGTRAVRRLKGRHIEFNARSGA